MKKTLLALVFASGAWCAQVAQAQGLVGLGLDYPMTTAPMINFSMNSMVNNNLMNTAARRSTSKQPALRANAAPAVQRNAQELAKVYPAPYRHQMTQVFQQSMDVYRKIEAKMGFEGNDLGGAMAAFIVGNYMVLNNREVPDEDFVAVAKQLRAQPALRALADKQGPEGVRNMYEQSAMVGAFMALVYKSQEQQRQPENVQANLRHSASENLKLALGTDPQRLRIDAQGMSIQ
jgi:hypothetical protein